MRLDMRPEPNPQFPRRVEHQLAIAPHHSGVQHHCRRLHVCQFAAEEVVGESCVRRLREERGGVVGRWW
jgi:DNA-directed RNA polymerase specialized sigma24 family protein